MMKQSLAALIDNNFGKAAFYTPEENEKYGGANMNCCERILYGANIAYDLGIINGVEEKGQLKFLPTFSAPRELARKLVEELEIVTPCARMTCASAPLLAAAWASVRRAGRSSAL